MKKKNLLLCFRPLTLESDQDSVIKHPCNYRDSNMLHLLNVDTNIKTPKAKLCNHEDTLGIARHRSRSLNSSSRSLCHDLKSVLVEASVQQQKQSQRYEKNADLKILRSRSHQDSTNTNKSIVSTESMEHNSVPFKTSSFSETNHRTLSSFTQSSSLSKSINYHRQIYADAMSKSSISGLVVVAMTLCATIFCGKVCAILLTSILFYCMPRQTCVNHRFKSVLKLSKETEKDCRKRVIMQGLLERNHYLIRCRVAK